VAFGCAAAGNFLSLVATLIAVELGHVVGLLLHELLLLLLRLRLLLLILHDLLLVADGWDYLLVLLSLMLILWLRLLRCCWRPWIAPLHRVQLLLRLGMIVGSNLWLASAMLHVLELLLSMARLEHQ